jgi:phosphotransferase system enzyme I (PtsI)
MKRLNGIPVSEGLVIGTALVYADAELPDIPRYTVSAERLDDEWRRFQNARADTVQAMRDSLKRSRRGMNADQIAIFETHLLMLEDPEFQEQLKTRLERDRQNIEWVVWEVSGEMSAKLRAVGDPYISERAEDIADVSRRLLKTLLSIPQTSLAQLPGAVILVVHDIPPSDMLSMNREQVQGIVMEAGSRTSHTAILTRAFGIPAVLGVSTATAQIQSGDRLVLDGGAGSVVINPDTGELARYETVRQGLDRISAENRALRELPAETLDAHRVSVKANIGTPEDAAGALAFGAEGIGLYRSEFLFLTQGRPTGEEQQYQAYSQVLQATEFPVTIRTIDVGGDKILPGMSGQDDKNPLLGWRAIRFSLAMPELFGEQLRAILRAGAHGRARILFPMISSPEELEQALGALEQAKEECRRRRQAFDEHIEAGCMIEIPAAAMIADILAKRAAFFSIGTNDLIQYTVAADRGNEKVSYLARQTHPAVLRLLKLTIDAAHQRGIATAMCGEMAGDPAVTPLLLGLGLDEFSMNAPAIPPVKRVIRASTLKDCRALAEKALACASYREVDALLEQHRVRYHEPPAARP